MAIFNEQSRDRGWSWSRRWVSASRVAGWLVIAVLALSACGQDVTASSAPTTAPHATTPALTPSLRPRVNGPQLSIDNFTFIPATLTVPAGATVTWTNHDDVPHTVTATDKHFTSQALDTDDQFSYRFTTPGTYNYYCTIHPKMQGTIIVR